MSGFMKPEVCYGTWVTVETRYGTYHVPGEFLSDAPDAAEVGPFVEGGAEGIESIEGPREGWGARLSAPGYLDATDWSLYPTEQEAREALADEFPEDLPDDSGGDCAECGEGVTSRTEDGLCADCA